MEGVDTANVDNKAGTAIVMMKPGFRFDEAKAHELIDKDYELISVTESQIVD